jgi:hypothetical protein
VLQPAGTFFLVRGLLTSSEVPDPPQTFVPPFVLQPSGAFSSTVNGVLVLTGTLVSGQLQFAWHADCPMLPPNFSSLGSGQLTFTGAKNPSP